MSRIRTVKPEFWTDEKVVSLTPLARLLFIGIWNFADDEGRGEYSPLRLKMQILPADPADASELLGEIRRAGMIDVYEVDGKAFFQVRNFAKHQKIDKRASSKLPPPPTSPESPRLPPNPADGMEKEREKEGKEDSEADASGGEPPLQLDSREACWAEGVPALLALGCSDRDARSNIGRWLKDHRPSDVLGAIYRARDHGTRDPIPLVGRILKPLENPKASDVRESKSAAAATRRIAQQLRDVEAGRGWPVIDLLAIGSG